MLTRPTLLLKLEDALLLVAILYLYTHLHLSWLLFTVLFLVPDLSMLGYLANPRAGAAAYNLIHTYILPLLLLAAGLFKPSTLVLSLALIWLAHIAFDRVLGYGLKYATFFKDTHLQHLG
jgi:hypothetical protein